MTHQENFTLPIELLEGIVANGLDYLPDLIRILVNAAMRAEREAWLGAVAYERSEHRPIQMCGPKIRKNRVHLSKQIH